MKECKQNGEVKIKRPLVLLSFLMLFSRESALGLKRTVQPGCSARPYIGCLCFRFLGRKLQ